MRPQPFKVVVKGTLSLALLGAIAKAEGFTASNVEFADGSTTCLMGWVPDQARLHSLIQMFADLNIELVSVNPMWHIDPEFFFTAPDDGNTQR